MARIRRIVVEKLFGVFDHDIRLNEGGITLIHGPNGYGKTAILSLVDELVNGTEPPASWPYTSFYLFLDGGEIVRRGKLAHRAMKDIHVRLIRTQRLTRAKPWDFLGSLAGSATPERGDAVSVVSHFLAELYQRVQTKYAEIAQSLERTFPKRVLELNTNRESSNAQLRSELLELEQRRRELVRLGLVARESDDAALPDREANDAARQILEVYVEDTRKKLAVFDDISHKAALFLDVINKRFTYKKVELSSEGIAIVTPRGDEIPTNHLSSGEQHELVLLYELLFETASGTLVMIDEPELSLHVAWQIEWLRDLERIVEVTGIDVLVATHSPQIINDRWDLTVELKGPEA